MGGMMKNETDVLTLQIKGDGPLGGITVTADTKGDVKGYVDHPEAMMPPKNGKLDVGGAVGIGLLNVIKDMGLKEPYVGQTILQTSEIAEDLTYYFATSEQVPSSVGLGVLMNKDNTVHCAGGFIVQVMPFISDEVLDKLEENIKKISSVTSMLDNGHTPEQMLEIAMEKRDKSGHDILYLLQDMREFELYGTVRAVISVCDSVNYITEPEELQEVFRLVNNYLDPKGVFIFDFNTRYKYEEILGDRTIAENREECSFIWDNYYYEDEKINEYDLSLFIETDKDSGLYRKYEETHYQRAYTLEEMKELIRKSGLEFVTAYDAFSKNAPMDTSERIYVIAREQGK